MLLFRAAFVCFAVFGCVRSNLPQVTPFTAVCAPQEVVDCRCLSGGSGRQTCVDDGSGYSVCDCARGIVFSAQPSPSFTVAQPFNDIEAYLVDENGNEVQETLPQLLSLELLEGEPDDLLGEFARPMMGGRAKFVGLSTERAFLNTALVARFRDLTATSNAFVVNPGAPVRLLLADQPLSRWELGINMLPAPVVEGRDVFDNVTTNAIDNVTVSIVSAAGSDAYRLVGTTVESLFGGRAVFDRLQLVADPSTTSVVSLRFGIGTSMRQVFLPLTIVKPDLDWARFGFAAQYDTLEATVNIDLKTGLYWAKDTEAVADYAAAAAHCAGLPDYTVADQAFSWRLPRYIELLSLMSGEPPASYIDPALAVSGLVATQTGAANAHITVDFAEGETQTQLDNVARTALCVLDTAVQRDTMGMDNAPSGQYDYIGGTAAVVDARTRLAWQQMHTDCGGGGCSLPDAIAACEALSLAGFDDWRVPKIRELASLVAIRRGGPRWDVDYFSGGNGNYWSATPSTAAGFHLAIDFNSGQLIADGDVGLRRVRCVRGIE